MAFDEATVARELSAELGEEIEPDDLDEDDFFGETVFKYETGQREYLVFEDDDAAERAAVAVVKQDLESEPEIFNQTWLMSHVDEKKLSDWVYQAVMEDEYAYEIAQDDPDRFWEEAEYWDIDIPDEDERPEDVPDEYIEELREAIAKDRAKDPMEWLGDIYGDEAPQQAMNIAGFDMDAAAQDAVDVDGWQHFLARYDGNSYETKSDFTYVRMNKTMKDALAKKSKRKRKRKRKNPVAELKNKLLR